MKTYFLIICVLMTIAGNSIAQNISSPKGKGGKRQTSNIVDSLKKVIREQQEIIVQQGEFLISADNFLHTGYVKIASKDELLSARLLTRGNHFRASSVNYSCFSPELFNSVDIRSKTEIEINSDTAKILTPVPSDSYKIEKGKHHNSVLRILDVDRFWGISKFLLIQK